MIDFIEIKKLFTIEKGSLQSTKCTEGEYDFITASSDWKTHNEYTHDQEALIVAVSASGSLGRVHYVNGKFISSDLCFILSPKSKEYQVDLSFYYYIFRSIREDLVKSTATGTSKLAINKTNFGNYKLPYVDIEKQRAYKEKLINIAERKEKLAVINEEQAGLIKNFPQQYLQDAIEGKLSKEWREENPNVEFGNVLIKKIRIEKERLIKEGKITKQKPLPPIKEEEIPFELPQGWVWCRLGDISEITRGKSPKYDENGVFKMLNQKCVRWFEVDLNYAKAISVDWYKSMSNTDRVRNNDVLVNSTGDGTIGRAAYASIDAVDFLFDSHILRVRSKINQSYVVNFINSSFGQKQVNDSKGAKSTKQHELGVKNLSNFLLPLPPLTEQEYIVACIESLFVKLDLVKELNTESQENISLLNQVVLKEMFDK